MSSRRDDALSRIVERYTGAGARLEEYERAAAGYSDAELEEAVGELLLSDSGPGAPFPWRLSKALATAHRNGTKDAPKSKRPAGWFYSSSVFDDPSWMNGRGPKMRVLANGPMPGLWAERIERLRAVGQRGEGFITAEEALDLELIGGVLAEIVRRGGDLGDLAQPLLTTKGAKVSLP